MNKKINIDLWKILEGAQISCCSKEIREIHPEFHNLKKFEWDGMISIRFESAKYSNDNSFSESERETIIRRIMNNLRSKWKLRNNNFHWVATIEFGKSNLAHAHILLSFSPLREKMRSLPCLSNLEDEFLESIGFLLDGTSDRLSSFDVNWRSTFSNDGLVSYFCKVEAGREDYKQFIWPKGFQNWKPDFPDYPLELHMEGVSNGFV